MLQASKVHLAGVKHRQLIGKLHHAVLHGNSLRIVDFSKARVHKCSGCHPLVRDRMLDNNDCSELALLESDSGRKSAASHFQKLVNEL